MTNTERKKPYRVDSCLCRFLLANTLAFVVFSIVVSGTLEGDIRNAIVIYILAGFAIAAALSMDAVPRGLRRPKVRIAILVLIVLTLASYVSPLQ